MYNKNLKSNKKDEEIDQIFKLTMNHNGPQEFGCKFIFKHVGFYNVYFISYKANFFFLPNLSFLLTNACACVSALL